MFSIAIVWIAARPGNPWRVRCNHARLSSHNVPNDISRTRVWEYDDASILPDAYAASEISHAFHGA